MKYNCRYDLVFTMLAVIYTVSQKKNNTDVAHYNFDADQPI